ncbi:MAG: YidC/Oxa1 family membrane protein insertase [Treponema sp.]|nr:YidC/Oxa1 family membrane protein insertase [Treponema sp.]
MPDFIYNIIIFPIIQIIEAAFFLSQKVFKETGISVIFVSLVISTLLLPLYAVAENWQLLERDIEKRLKPKITKIKNVFKGDEQYMILSAYYRQNHYHPVYAMRSTFGLLIQIPFFIAAYSFLSHLEAIKNVPFLFIRDLGSPDALFSAGNFTINLLPIAMTLINFLACAVYTNGLFFKNKMQLYGMAGIFLILLYNSPSALVLYWSMNNVFSLAKNIYYRIKSKYKPYILLVLFSFALAALAVFCIINYYYDSKGQKLAVLCFFTALAPWLFVIFKKRRFKINLLSCNPEKSLSIFLFSIFLCFILFGLFLPSQLIASSPQEFSFIDTVNNPLFFLLNTAFQVFGFFVFWPICLYSLFSDETKKYFSVFSAVLTLGIIINVFIFSGNYGRISISFIFESGPNHSAKEILLNIFILFLPFAAAFILNKLKYRKLVLTAFSLCIFSLFSISVFNIIKINAAYHDLKTYYKNEQEELREIAPLSSLSRNGKNIAVFMLDRAASVFMPYIFEESPELKEIYSGFVFYPNTVSFASGTRVGAPAVFGGYDYTPAETNKRDNITLVEKHNESLVMLPRILSENGFTVCITDPPDVNYNWKSDLNIFNIGNDNINVYSTYAQYTDYWLKEHDLKLPKTEYVIKRNIFWYSLHKGLPLFFRQPVYMKGDWFSTASNQSLRNSIGGYSVLDYLPRLFEITDDAVNTAFIMSNDLTHDNSFLQAPEYIPVIAVADYGNTRFAKEAAYHVNAAAIKLLAKWLEYLKTENVYDNTRIILVSDHGPGKNFVTKIGLPFYVDEYNPILLVKDFYDSGELKTDMTFMSNADVPFLALTGIIDDPRNPFTGNAISMEQKKTPLYIAVSVKTGHAKREYTRYPFDPKIDHYVHGNIFDEKNWSKAEK